MREIRRQLYLSEVDHHFARMFEIHRYPMADAGLHLSQAPVRLLRMSHHHARL